MVQTWKERLLMRKMPRITLYKKVWCKIRYWQSLKDVSDKELAKMLSDQYFNEPLKYQSGLFSLLIMQGCMKSEDADTMALQFFSPIYLLMTVCDREPEREAEALQMLDKHIRQFCRLYKGENTSTGLPDHAKE